MHFVTNVLAEDELWVEPDLVALDVVFDYSFALFDLLGVLFVLIYEGQSKYVHVDILTM